VSVGLQPFDPPSQRLVALSQPVVGLVKAAKLGPHLGKPATHLRGQVIHPEVDVVDPLVRERAAFRHLPDLVAQALGSDARLTPSAVDLGAQAPALRIDLGVLDAWSPRVTEPTRSRTSRPGKRPGATRAPRTIAHEDGRREAYAPPPMRSTMRSSSNHRLDSRE
jgi:hypothetical protein